MDKLVAFENLLSWREKLTTDSRPLVVTNGCFDLLHVGHVRYLSQAADFGSLLLVGINDDAGVRSLKGPSRPLNPDLDRAEVLAALGCVGAVCIFPGSRATEFLQRARPDIYVKGGDYTPESLYPPERDALHACGARIECVELVPGRSTSSLVKKIGEGRP